MIRERLNVGKKLICVFQGGGALGSFQVGCVEALLQSNQHPDMVVGGSIGGINAAIIAGNSPENRIKQLKKFWKKITTNINTFGFSLPDFNGYKMSNLFGAMSSMVFGQPGFYSPRIMNQWLLSPKLEDLALYDIEPLRRTLSEVIDFDYLNQGHIRLCLSATDLENGKLVFFDSAKDVITVDHILASGALPPGFPAVKINGRYYIDGAIYANSPQMGILDNYINDEFFVDARCFVFDLFSADGILPKSIDGLMERMKDIRFASHSEHSLLQYQSSQKLAYAIDKLYNKLPEEFKNLPEMQDVVNLNKPLSLELIHIPYRSSTGTELESKDYNFSYDSAVRHMKQGFDVTDKALKELPLKSKQNTCKIYTVNNKKQLHEII